MEDKKGELYPISDKAGGGIHEPEYGLLSYIIERIDEVYGIELTEEDKLDLEHVTELMQKHDELGQVMSGQILLYLEYY